MRMLRLFRLRFYQAKAFALSAVLFSIHSAIAQTLPAATEEEAPVKEPIRDRCQLLAEADRYAIDQLGFQDADQNGIPDYRETYIYSVNDCSTVSDQFDWILEQMAKNGQLNPKQGFEACQLRGGNHAANLVPEIGIVDVTPTGYGASKTGICFYQFPDDTQKNLNGYPDPDEVTDPAYGGPRLPPRDSTIPEVVVTPASPITTPVTEVEPKKSKWKKWQKKKGKSKNKHAKRRKKRLKK